MGHADMQSVADVVALDDERQKRAQEAEASLSTAGGMLKAAREAMGLSIGDVARRTNIKAEHLSAIETMTIDALPAQPYTMGFVRAYAREVSLPEDALLDRFRQQAGYTRRELAKGIKAPATGGERDGGRELSALAILGIIGLVLFSVWKLLVATAPEETGEASRFAFSKDDRGVVLEAPATTPVVIEGPAEAPQPASDVADPAVEETVATDLAVEEAPAAADVSSEAPEVAEAEEVAEEPVIALRQTTRVEPVYPPLCEGSAAEVETVTISFAVTASGRTVSPRITGSTNPCFNGAALAALSRWRYAPETVTPQTGRQTARFSFDRPY